MPGECGILIMLEQGRYTRIGEMVALDTQPFSIMEDDGFTHLVKISIT